MAQQGNAPGTMGGSSMDPNMAAERAVIENEIKLLRDQLGAKFYEIENGAQGLAGLRGKLGEFAKDLTTLGDNVTDAFQNNNALIRHEIRAAFEDVVKEIEIDWQVRKN